MEKYDTSQLTEFPRFESDSNQGGVSTFLNKLWKFPIFTPTETAENQESKLPSDTKPNEQTNVDAEKEYEDKMETGSYVEEYEGRSLPNILKRISGLVALGSGSGTKYSDTDLARYWMPDDISRECYECAARFSTLRRRHHCRVCGQIFCSRCCSQRVPGKIFGCAGGLRVCTYCCKVVLTYLRENDLAGDISPDLKTLQESLQVKFPENKSQSHKSRDFIFAREQDPCEVRSSSKEALHDVYRMLYFALPTQLHRYRLVRYNNVWRGCDIMQWLMDNTSHKTRAQATLFCQSLLSAGCMERVTEPPQFADYALYRPVHVQGGDGTDTAPDEECNNRLVESVSSYCLDLNLGNSSARLIKATKTEPPSTPSSEEDHPILDHQEKCTKPACKAIEQSGGEHLRLLVRQWLARAALAPAWLHALYPLCVRAAECIVLDMMSSDIDVRNYVQVKKVPGGSMSDSCLVNGVVITKNVAHRGMPKKIKNPSVLLLDCSITYQRVEGKLTSLEPLLMQEQEYLVRCAARIAALQPSVVLVRGSTARAVQDSLRARGVALALGVRDRALKRAARATKADLVASIDARIGTPRLGTCEQFYVNSYSSKTLMVLEGCAEPQLGCCILLRGGSLQELIRVKRLVKFMLLACYNWKLEKAFLADIEAILPEPGTFVDDDLENESEVKDITKNTSINSQNNDDGNSSNDTSEADEVIFGNNPNLSKDTKSLNSDKIESRNGNDKQESDKTGDKKDIQETEEQLKEKDMEKSIEIDDPLQKSKQFSRKTDNDKNLSCGVLIKDFSDPLQSRLSIEDDVFLPKEEAKLKADTQNERWCTDDIVLSMSPNIVIPAPTLPLARPAPAAPASSHPPHTPRAYRKGDSRPAMSSRPESPRPTLHPFVERPITAPADDPALRASLAHFRATGCSIVGNHKPQCTKYNTSIVKKVEAEETKSSDPEPLDPLSPENHQRLSVLLYSYSSKSPNVPDFCMNPWVVTMEMYGRNDISLGAFLEKYCFNGDNKCPSTNCHIPMNQHERKFVHEDVCITITCNTIGHSNVDKVKEEQSKQVMFWSRCERCGAVSRGARLSRAALSLSLAQYVRARVSAPRYRRPQCAHACHAHSHAFVSRLTTACFKYNKIATYSVQLPPDVISINYDTRLMRDALIAHLNDLMLRGHEAFSNATEPDGEKAYAAFKQHMEQIHLALTTDDNNSLAERVRKLWNVHDAIINGEKMLRDSSDAHRHRPPPETTSEDKSDPDEVPDITSIDAAETLIKDSEKEHTGTEEDEEKGDKKTVKQILSQLLSNNQPSNQEGMIITSGVIPVVVKAGEIGSVIAAALASVTYTKTLQSQRMASQNDFEDGENTSSVKEKADGDKAKAKSNDHIEVLLKDGLLCRVYYASQFHKLRHMLLSPLEYSEDARTHWEEAKCCDDVTARGKDNKGLCEIEEGFIRSLAHCVPWAARGGKSGSTFCKTKDDRYVLKEMTKPEWQQFLEFAPHYFNYVTNCRQKKLPSLLARILGVFSVGGAGSGVLVTEHVWYGTNADGTRYDLKGISKPRPLNNAPVHSPDAVLLDDHLLKSRWEHQLAVRGAGARALCGGVERDTRFLADNAVMDYSLLLGVHDGLLVLGIIDYIRTFTWDKKLEHLVKKNLGSGQPTVVSPDQYRRRFQTACAKYFLQCPAHWDHLYADCSYNA